MWVIVYQTQTAPRAAFLYPYSGADTVASSAAQASEQAVTIPARRLWTSRPSTAYLFSSTAQDFSAPAAASHQAVPWRPATLWRTVPSTAYLFNRTAQDTSAPVEAEGGSVWRSRWTFQPAWAPVVSFFGALSATAPTPPPPSPDAETNVNWQPAPVRTAIPNLRATNLYYQQNTAEDFGEGPSAQFLVFWQYRTAYEDHVRQFFVRNLQGQPPQDNDESAQPSTFAFWRPRGIQVPKVPPSAFINLYYTELSSDASAPVQPETTHPWRAQQLKQNAVPKSAFLNYYFTESAQDTSAPIQPETNPQWTQRWVGQNRVPRAAFLNLYSSSEDIPAIPETTPGWQPKPLWDSPTPISTFLQLYLSHTAQDDNAPVATILQGWKPRPLNPYTLPHYWFYAWGLANPEQSSADDIGRSGWVATALRTPVVPRAAYLYYRSSTARDDNAPPPPPPPTGHGSEFPQWLRRARLLQYHP